MSLFHHYLIYFKNVVYSLEPGQTPSFSASNQAPKVCAAFLNIAIYFKTVRCGCGSVAVNFFNLLMFSTVHLYRKEAQQFISLAV